MKDSIPSSVAPPSSVAIHCSVLGAEVILSEEARRSLEIDWVEGTVITVIATFSIVGRPHVQLVNETTGQISKPVRLEEVRFSPETIASRERVRAYAATARLPGPHIPTNK